MAKCLHCGTEYPAEQGACPHCGGKAPKTAEPDASPVGQTRRSAAKTQVSETSAGAPGQPSAPPPAGGAPPRRQTVVEADYQGDHLARRARGRTMVVSSEPKAPEATPCLAGFLVTFGKDPAGEYYVLREGRRIIGSGADCDILVDDPAASRHHAIILFRRGQFILRDELSTNGTFVNGQEVVGDLVLQNYDRLGIGNSEYVLIFAQAPVS